MEGEGRRGREGGREQRKRERGREGEGREGVEGERERGGREWKERGWEGRERGGRGKGGRRSGKEREREREEREDKIILRDCSELPIPQSLLNQAPLWPSPQGPLPGMGCNALYVPPHTPVHTYLSYMYLPHACHDGETRVLAW